MTAGNAATDLKTLRIGVISPNLAYGLDWMPDSDHRDAVWPLESVAKKVSLLFDRIYLTHDLDVTCEIVGSYEENAETATLRYLAARRCSSCRKNWAMIPARPLSPPTRPARPPHCTGV